jgi:molecular chaperone DnaJ
MSEDFYEALGVSRDASEEEINRAYREKASEYHPDVSDDPDAEEKFKRIQKAKEVLTDEEKRQAYDRMGHDRFVQADKQGGFDDDGRGAGGRAGPGAGGAGPFGGGGGIGDIFDEFFGGGGRGGRQRSGQDLRTGLRIDLEEAYEGATKRVSVRRPEECNTCNGRGYPPGADARTCPECNGRGQTTQVQQTPLGRVQQRTTCRRCGGEGELYSETCSTCGGDGTTRESATLTVDIPAGISDGQSLRMDGEGAPPEDAPGPNGDLLIEVSVRDHDEFEREGDDIHYVEPISFPKAVFGDTVEVPTLGGSVEMDIPAGTQSGETFRLSGKGMPRLRGRGSGDQYVHVQIVTPDDLNTEQREALKEFAEAGGEDVDVQQGFFEKIKNSL